MEGKEILLQLAIIYVSARIGGYISKKFKQPEVLGEMLMGIIIGPSVLNLFKLLSVSPTEFDTHVLHVFSELGVIFLMFMAGLETNVNELRSSAKSFTIIALGGVFVPIILGFGATKMLGIENSTEALFIGLVLAATSVSITVQTLRELKQLRSKQGTAILGAAIIDDVIGIILLAIFLGIATGEGNVMLTITHMIIYFVCVFVFGIIFHKIINKYGYMLNLSASMTIVALVLCLVLAYFAEKAEIAAITGAYIAGVILATTTYRAKIVHHFEIASYLFFTPIFFVGIGMNAQISGVGSNILLIIAILAAAIIGKIIGSGLGAKTMGFNSKQAVQIGIGMAPRGEVALIISNIGLKHNIISQNVFTAMIIVVILTALITPVLLKSVFKGEKCVDDELAYEGDDE